MDGKYIPLLCDCKAGMCKANPFKPIEELDLKAFIIQISKDFRPLKFQSVMGEIK